MKPEPDAFDLLAEIPPGITVLEASAGTGKTYAIAALATRLAAEGVPLEHMLLVTFTRMATGELRERVRERLSSSERHLRACLAGADPQRGRDALDVMLGTGDPAAVRQRREHLARALADFDAATIETTHSFCREVLTELGTVADLDPDVTLTEHVDDLLGEVVDDLYIRRFITHTGPPGLDRDQAGHIAREAVRNIDAVIHPITEPPDADAAMRWRFAHRVRSELADRKRARGVITYDDLLGRLLGTLSGPHGDVAVARLRERFRVVLIDEFQDTDPVQWQIVSRAFGDGGIRLVLIADPKQAIYAFRGADVHAYLHAARAATRRASLDVNFRSDAPLLSGLDALFAGMQLGHPEIRYRRVHACPDHHGARLRGAPGLGALRVRVLSRDAIALTPTGFANVSAARAAVAADVAADIVALLDSGARIEARDRSGAVTGLTPVGPGDIAVLVPTHRNAAAVERELAAASVPAVIGGAGSVLATPAADHWLSLLEALERPASAVRARTAALGPLIGWDAARLAEAGQSDVESLHGRLYRWSRTFAEAGMAAMTQAVLVDGEVAVRLLGWRGGERLVTDLVHVAELLHRASIEEQLGLAALTAWLRARIEAAGREGAHGDERTRRLDTDAAAVQVLTIHRSKGLEWPVVYCPYLWDTGRIPDHQEPVSFHRDGLRAVDVTLEGAGYEANRRTHRAEERGEDLRLAYVALTRARHRVVLHWAGSYDAGNAPLTRMLFARRPDGSVAVDGPRTPSDSDTFAAFTAIAAISGDPAGMGVEWARPAGMPASWSATPAAGDTLAAARLGRAIDRRWRRTSYSALTAAAHGSRVVGSEPEAGLLGDEPVPEVPAAGVLGLSRPDGGARATADREAALSPPPLAGMAFGPAVGTLVHRALDLSDFAAASLRGELALRLAEAGGPRGVGLLGAPVAEVANGLADALSTPIPALADRSLAGVTRSDRLDELTFELPLGGGDRPHAEVVTLAHVACLLREWLDPTDPLAGYADRLEDPLLSGLLRGYLTGSIDLVLRLPAADGRPRFAVVDYKTNWLARPGEPLALADYRPVALAAEMQRSHYLLQGLLYCVALHRFLRWRQVGYEPARDLAGIHYLFLRGMSGGPGAGIFSWQPPAGLVPALSDLLDRGEPPA
ncbi:MAG TPA: UvrD-helicase domain-containing protein [Solirubrobacteraceae bacterium]|nr:UvrD-helicase domain-containing protein [Solirubrobacteraceae bacterium]